MGVPNRLIEARGTGGRHKGAHRSRDHVLVDSGLGRGGRRREPLRSPDRRNGELVDTGFEGAESATKYRVSNDRVLVDSGLKGAEGAAVGYPQ